MAKSFVRSSSRIEPLEGRQLFAGVGFGAGVLDPTFGGDGRSVVAFTGRRLDTVYASAVQPDGKIVVVGSTNSSIGNGTDIAVARLNPDASLDTSFGVTLDNGVGGGLFEIPLPTSDDNAFGVVLQPDGKILIAGSVADSSTGSFLSQAVVIRLTAEGAPDDTFGTGVEDGGTGFVFINLSKDPADSTFNSEARAVALQVDGKIIIAGAADVDISTGSANFAVTRLFPNGAVDTSFGEFGTGTEVDGFPGVFTEAYAVAVDSQQRVVLTGTAIVPGDGVFTQTAGIFVVARLTPDGVPDNSFGDGGSTGTVFEPFGSETVVPVSTSLVIQPDGKLLAGGIVVHADQSTGESVTGFALARYNADGTDDLTFGAGKGYVETYFLANGANAPAIANQIVVLPGGKFLVAGRAAQPSTPETFNSLAVARYNPDGSVDRTFNARGQQPGQLLLGPDGAIAASIRPAASFNNAAQTAGAQLAVVPGGGILLIASQGSSLSVTRLVADGPDLITSGVLIKGGSFLAGSKSTASVRLANQGSLNFSGTVPVTLRLSADATYSDDDRVITTVPMKLALKPGTLRAVTVKFAYPAGETVSGQFFVVVDANDTRAATEGNFLNNRSGSTTVVALAPAFVDLSATLTAAPGSALRGKKGSYSITLTNAGNIPAAGSVTLQLFASTDGTESPDDIALLSKKPTKLSLKGGTTRTLKLTNLIPATAQPGTYVLLLKIDASPLTGAKNPLRVLATSTPITLT